MPKGSLTVAQDYSGHATSPAVDVRRHFSSKLLQGPQQDPTWFVVYAVAQHDGVQDLAVTARCCLLLLMGSVWRLLVVPYTP